VIDAKQGGQLVTDWCVVNPAARPGDQAFSARFAAHMMLARARSGGLGSAMGPLLEREQMASANDRRARRPPGMSSTAR